MINYTEHLTVLMQDIVSRVPTLSFIDIRDVLVFARFNGAPLCCLFRERHVFTPGQPIRLMPQLNAVHLFDAQSGERIRAG